MIYTARQLTPASPSLKSGGGGGRVLTAAAGEARELAAGAASDGRDALRSLSECVGRQARRRADAQGACVQATTHARGSYTHDRLQYLTRYYPIYTARPDATKLPRRVASRRTV